MLVVLAAQERSAGQGDCVEEPPGWPGAEWRPVGRRNQLQIGRPFVAVQL